MMWQVYDWYLRPNAGYYSMRSACRPLHVQASADDLEVQVVSTLPEPRPGLKVRMRVTDAAGCVEGSAKWPSTRRPTRRRPQGRCPRSSRTAGCTSSTWNCRDADNRELERVVNWVQADCRWHELLKSPPVRIDAALLERRQEGEETLWRFSLHNASSVAAVDVWVELLCGCQGEEILPTFWSDNAFVLLPGQRRELTARVRTRLLPPAPPHLMVEGWNVLPREFDLADAAEGALVERGHRVPLRRRATSCGCSSQPPRAAPPGPAGRRGPCPSAWTKTSCVAFASR